MKYLKSLCLIPLCACFIQANRPSPDPMVFWASTPCDAYPRSLMAIPVTADCEFIQWTLMLQRHPRTQEPTLFKLNYSWGMSKPSTEGFMNGGTQGMIEGRWSSKQLTDHKLSYQLTPAHASHHSVSLVRLHDNLLHLLDKEGKLMIGHAGWSYTLNRK